MFISCLGNDRKGSPSKTSKSLPKKEEKSNAIENFLKKTSKFLNFFESSTPNESKKPEFIKKEEIFSKGYSSSLGIDSLQESKTKRFSIKEWLTVLDVNDIKITPHLELLSSLRMGIPDQLRPRIWFFLGKINEIKKQHVDNIYNRLKTSISHADNDIKKDLPRTFSDHPFFYENNANQQILFNILRAYANYDSVLGYTQGMNYVVAAMMIILNPQNYDNLKFSFDFQGKNFLEDEDYEEKIFWLLIFINYKKNWREVYREGMSKTFDLLKYFKKEMDKKIPEIKLKIEEFELDIQMCFDQAFITILLYYTPLDFSKRIIDLFLLEGESVIFSILIRIMLITKKKILEYKTSEDLFNYIRKDMIKESFIDYKEDLKLLLPLPQTENINF